MTQITVHGMHFDVDALTEQGPRPENQDAFSIDTFAETGLLAVADGMGGEKSGRTAANAALEALQVNGPIRSIDEARRAVREADRRVTRTAEADPERHGGMGSALGLLALIRAEGGPGWIAAHVGDVRILSRSPDGVLRLETRDHTPAFSRWEAGEISLDEIPDSAGANRLQRAIGRGGEADVGWIPVAPGWSWVIISDGVYKAMRLEELSAALGSPSAADACAAIRRKVDERGADDNYTAIVVRALPAAASIYPNGTSDSMTSERSTASPRRAGAGAALAMALAVLALVLAAAALWTARETSVNAAPAMELERLRVELDSVRAVVGEVTDPFAPSAPLQPPPTRMQPESTPQTVPPR